MWWPPDLAAAPDPAAGLDLAQLWGPILAVVGVTIAGAFTLIGTFRSSGRASQTQRDMQLDERADKQAARLEDENSQLRARVEDVTGQRDDYRERWVRLRIGVINAGLNPDDLIADQKGNTDAT